MFGAYLNQLADSPDVKKASGRPPPAVRTAPAGSRLASIPSGRVQKPDAPLSSRSVSKGLVKKSKEVQGLEPERSQAALMPSRPSSASPLVVAATQEGPFFSASTSPTCGGEQ